MADYEDFVAGIIGDVVRERRCCAQCSMPIDNLRADAKYCSDGCRQKAARRRNQVVAYAFCEYCDRRFKNTSRRAKYCSDACRQAAYRERKANV